MSLMGSSGLDITEAISSAIPDPFFIFDEHGYYVDIIGTWPSSP